MSLPFLVGDLTIHRIIEQETTFLPAFEMFPGLTPDLLAKNRPWMRQAGAIDADDVLILCFQSYIVTTPDHTILVDSCIGNDKPRTRPKWNMKTDSEYMLALAAAGFTVDDIDFVMCTHMHVDHVGWNMLAGAPFFPNARYLGHRADFELFTQEHANRPYVRDQLLGLAATGRLELVDDGTAPLPGVALEHVPGHTPGHCIVRVDDAVLLGDLAVHELQLADPGLAYVAEEDAPAAAAARRRFLPALAASGAVVGLGHLRPPLGRIAAAGDGFAWRPLD
jgi:glyoxylase-like metal-dependent hydrolase (beta-lactamase superfamily II)